MWINCYSKWLLYISSKEIGTESARNLVANFFIMRKAPWRQLWPFVGCGKLPFRPLSSHGIQAAPWSRISAMTRVLGANPILLPSRFPRQVRLAMARRIFYPLTAVVQRDITTLVSTYQLTGKDRKLMCAHCHSRSIYCCLCKSWVSWSAPSCW